jgi:hypothetical protein
MTVREYQIVYKHNNNIKDEVERMAFIVMDLFNLPYSKVDSMSKRTFLKKVNKVTKKFKQTFKKPFYCLLKLETDATKINLAQFIEASYFLKSDPIPNLHFLAATLLKKKNKKHAVESEKMLNTNINYIMSDCVNFINSLQVLLMSYKGLFQIPDEEQERIIEKPIIKSHPFVEKYGWIFSAKQVAEFEGIPLEKAYDLNIIHALNTLSLLKSKKDYEAYLMK